MSPDPSDQEAALQFELRRRLAVISATTETLLEDSFGPLTSDQRRALETVLTASNELSALLSHDPEPGRDGRALDVAVDPTAHSPAVSDADRSVSIALVVESPTLSAALIDRLEQSGYDPATPSSLEAALEGDTGSDGTTDGDVAAERHLVVDWDALPTPTLECLANRVERLEPATSLVLVSTVDHESLPAPFLGYSGILSPDASPATVVDALELVARDAGADARIAAVGTIDDPDLDVILPALEGLDRPVDAISLEALPEYVDRETVECLFLSASAVDAIDDALLRALRTPRPSRPTDDSSAESWADSQVIPIPLIAVGPTPTGADWFPVCGVSAFSYRSVTALELAGEILLTIDPEGWS